MLGYRTLADSSVYYWDDTRIQLDFYPNDFHYFDLVLRTCSLLVAAWSSMHACMNECMNNFCNVLL